MRRAHPHGRAQIVPLSVSSACSHCTVGRGWQGLGGCSCARRRRRQGRGCCFRQQIQSGQVQLQRLQRSGQRLGQAGLEPDLRGLPRGLHPTAPPIGQAHELAAADLTRVVAHQTSWSHCVPRPRHPLIPPSSCLPWRSSAPALRPGPLRLQAAAGSQARA